jgi:hypothetical protein
MAVKIIKIDPIPEVLKQCYCRGCGATLQYTPNDVKSYHGTDIGGGPDGCEWIVCANCGKDVVLRSW